MSLWKKLLWVTVTLLGLASLAVLALSRGEQISALWIIVAGLCGAAISYRFYSKWIATKILVLNESVRRRPSFGTMAKTSCPRIGGWFSVIISRRLLDR